MTWLKGIAMDGLMAALIVAGFVYGEGWAVNVVVFLMWVGVVLAAFGAFAADQMVESGALSGSKIEAFRSKVWRWYDVMTDIAFVLTFAGLGYFGLAFCVALSKMFFKSEVYRAIDEHYEATE